MRWVKSLPFLLTAGCAAYSAATQATAKGKERPLSPERKLPPKEEWNALLKTSPETAIPMLLRSFTFGSSDEKHKLEEVVERHKMDIYYYLVLHTKLPFSPEEGIVITTGLLQFFDQEEGRDLVKSAARQWEYKHLCFVPSEHPGLQLNRTFLPYSPDMIAAGFRGGGCGDEDVIKAVTQYRFVGDPTEYGILIETFKRKQLWPNNLRFRSNILNGLFQLRARPKEFVEGVRHLFEQIQSSSPPSYNNEDVQEDYWNSVSAFGWLLETVEPGTAKDFIEEAMRKRPLFAPAFYEAAKPIIDRLPAADQTALATLARQFEEADTSTVSRQLRDAFVERREQYDRLERRRRR